MKSKIKLFFLLILLIIFSFSSIISYRFSKDITTHNNYLEYNEKDQIHIKLSGFWDLTGSKISIDDSNSSKNWSYTALNYAWCSGSGNWTDPYVIENVTINAQYSGSCIEIKNSDVYFIVRNCLLYNTGYSWDDAGIKLDNVDSGNIINNDCSNNYRGIGLSSSNNNTVSGNSANYNWYGIYLQNSDNNTLSGNTASNSNHDGIYLSGGSNNKLFGNSLNFCGISLSGSLVEMTSHSIDNTNLANNKPVYYYTNEIGLESSNFTNAGQIILINYTNSIISGVNISDGIGINLYYCVNNTLSGNTASNNYDSGISLYKSDNNTLSGNTAINNVHGIYLIYSHYNTLSGNTANDNGRGINLDFSNYNTLSGNSANDNTYGIFLSNNDNNMIAGNTADNNNYGIYLARSDNNTLSGNIADNNNRGIYLDSSDNNTLSGNIISNCRYRGIYVGYSNNNALSGNLLNSCGVSLGGPLVEMASHSIDITNLVNNKPVYYYVNETGLESSNFTNAGQIILINCTNSIISGLNISDSTAGIFLGYSNTNTLSGNIISDNYYGIWLDSNSINNKIVLNYFINNIINAMDYGVNNKWDNGTIGNYWDDYSGIDANYDGIGDTPYLINVNADSQDNFPILLNDDYIAPVIRIIVPLPDSILGMDAPFYIISVEEVNLDTIWYTLDGGGTNYTIRGLTGTFNQAAWEVLSGGSVTIRFYANDTWGNIGFMDVEVIIEVPDGVPIISFGYYYVLFTFIAILSIVILERQKKK